jgi:hypothetical protein
MREAGFDDEAEGVRIAGKVVNNLRYADDTTLLAGKKEVLKNNIRKLRLESEKAGLYFNIKKTKIMTTENWRSFEVDGEEIEVVSSFCFLGATIDREGDARERYAEELLWEKEQCRDWKRYGRIKR